MCYQITWVERVGRKVHLQVLLLMAPVHQRIQWRLVVAIAARIRQIQFTKAIALVYYRRFHRLGWLLRILYFIIVQTFYKL